MLPDGAERTTAPEPPALLPTLVLDWGAPYKKEVTRENIRKMNIIIWTQIIDICYKINLIINENSCFKLTN